MSGESVLVRALESSDLDGLLALYRDIGLVKPDDPSARLEQTWQRILASDQLTYAGAFVAGTLASTCHAVIIPNLTRGVRPYAVIENVGTLATHRHRGLGRLAMQFVIHACWRADCYKIMLATRLSNTGAQAFYRSLGFDDQVKQSFILSR